MIAKNRPSSAPVLDADPPDKKAREPQNSTPEPARRPRRHRVFASRCTRVSPPLYPPRVSCQEESGPLDPFQGVPVAPVTQTILVQTSVTDRPATRDKLSPMSRVRPRFVQGVPRTPTSDQSARPAVSSRTPTPSPTARFCYSLHRDFKRPPIPFDPDEAKALLNRSDSRRASSQIRIHHQPF